MGKGVIPDDHPLCVAPARSRLINIPLILYSTFGNFVFLQFFPFGPHSPWSSKNLIVWNQFKKFMQVGVDVKCMHTNFGGRDLSGFGDLAPF